MLGVVLKKSHSVTVGFTADSPVSRHLCPQVILCIMTSIQSHLNFPQQARQGMSSLMKNSVQNFKIKIIAKVLFYKFPNAEQ